MVASWFAFITIAVGGAFGQADPPPDAVMGQGIRLVSPEDPPPVSFVCADGPELHGIDVSKWNGDINWSTVAASGVEYAFVRVSDGTTHFDPFFAENWAESRAAGIYTGVYQFFRPNQSVQAQAQLLLDNMGQLGGPHDLPPVIDVEAHGNMSASAVAAAVDQWIDIVESATGVKPIVYTGRFFWQDHVASSAFSDYPLWIAHYTTGCPNLPSQWDDWAFHQYTDSGSVPGISGNVDLNDFNGDLAALEQYLAEPGVCGDGNCGGGENSDDCPADCVPCGTVEDTASTVIDDGSECFEMFGDDEYWRQVAGFGGSAFWTGTTATQTYNYVHWQLDFDQAGVYRVEAHIPAGVATITNATYEVHTAAGLVEASINQSSADGWVELGAFDFSQGGQGQKIKLVDQQGASGLQLAFDAVRLTPANGVQPTLPSDDDSDPGGDGSPDGDDDSGDSGDDSGGDPDRADDADTDAEPGTLPGARGGEYPQSCSVVPRQPVAPFALVLCVMGLLRRRLGPAGGPTE